MLPTETIRELVARHGIGAKFVRAYCKAMGWRYTAQGAPEQWFEAWRNGLAVVLSEVPRDLPASP